MSSTIYKLLAPMAIFKLMQHRLTFVDLTVDPRIAAQYTLAKILYLTMTCDYEFAAEQPRLQYDPNVDEWQDKRESNPAMYWRQGLYLGRLDNALDDLLNSESENVRLRTFGEYESFLKKRTDDYSPDSLMLTDIFHKFHPKTRPVLWRVLIAQAHIQQLVLARVGASSTHPLQELRAHLAIPADERAPFDWRTTDSSAPDDSVLTEPFDVATGFLTRYLEELGRNVWHYKSLYQSGG